MRVSDRWSGTWLLGLAAWFSLSGIGAANAEETTYDVVIYGGTSAAITAAVQAQEMGKSVIIVSPDKHLGGLSSGGLGCELEGFRSGSLNQVLPVESLIRRHSPSSDGAPAPG